jgi:CheY-like chemotaxis protein
MVLLVDDDEDLRDSVRDLLQRRGYTVATAEDGAAALSKLAQMERPCIVLLDLVMPGMDGWKLLTALQADPTFAAVPVVVASAHAATHAPAGAVSVLRKPFALDELFRVVEHHCGPPPCV